MATAEAEAVEEVAVLSLLVFWCTSWGAAGWVAIASMGEGFEGLPDSSERAGGLKLGGLFVDVFYLTWYGSSTM